MSFSPLARFRNYTVKNLKALLEVYPDMASGMSWGEAGDYAERTMEGYKRTAEQQGCQFGLEDRSESGFHMQTYLYTFEDGNLERYVRFWIKTYYAPNPYVKSQDEPFLIYCELAREILAAPGHAVDYGEFFGRRIGGGSRDILLNCLKNYAMPLVYRQDRGRDWFSVDGENLAALEEEVDFIETEFPIVDARDRKTFFLRYTYANFCRFYRIDREVPESWTAEEAGWPAALEAGGAAGGPAALEAGGAAGDPAGGAAEGSRIEGSAGRSAGGSGAGEAGGSAALPAWQRERLPGPGAGPRVTGGENVLLYGVPGAGKSHAIRTGYCSDPRRMERVVFHPDYTYSDFVGQILPRAEGERVAYVYVPGPFTRLLYRAWNDPLHPYYLVIEEINRGNAPAVFGEIFQLLDRKRAGQYPAGETGESEYGIANYDVARIVYGDESQEVRIPSNMHVLATMNTSDQNVFTLDTAFQRRFNLRHIRNRVTDAAHANVLIEGTGISWGVFASEINRRLTEAETYTVSSEDRRLGGYFVAEEELAAEQFSEKVLKYLWDDAFQMDREAVFGEEFRALDQVLSAYQEAEGDRLGRVLKEEVYRSMRRRMEETGPEAEDSPGDGGELTWRQGGDGGFAS